MKKSTYYTLAIEEVTMDVESAILAESNEQSSWGFAGEDDWTI